MPFVKLDTGILNSTLWIEREARTVFITALLMAEPIELRESKPQYHVRSLEKTGFVVVPGWYGFVAAAGSGIVRTALCDPEEGMRALERLGSPDEESRTPDFEGRRLVRIDGGYIVLNFMKYREKDSTTKERSARYRLRLKMQESRRDSVASRRDDTVNVTLSHQAEAEAEAEATEAKASAAQKKPRGSRSCPKDFNPPNAKTWIDEFCPGLDWQRETAKFMDHTFKTAHQDWDGAWRNWMRRAFDTRPSAGAQTFRERDAANAAARVHEMTGGLVAAKQAPVTRRNDALQEVFDATTPKRLG